MISSKHLKSGLASTAMVLIAIALLLPVNAWSQIEEIIVTARKKEESLQDVPLAVTAFTKEQIERRGIRNIANVAKYTASLQFDESFAQSDTRIVARGLSPTRGRQNVAVLLDGIDVSSEAISSSGGSLLLNTRLIDIERIEVVLGPQMVQYGRSAFNGAINYVTQDTSDEFTAELLADANDEDQYTLQGSVSAPLIGDLLGFRLNASVWDDEGFHDNRITDDEVGGRQGYGLALTLDSLIGENFSLKFRAEYTDDEGEPSAQTLLPFNTARPAPEGAFETGIAECSPGLNNALVTARVPGVGQPPPPDHVPNLAARADRIVNPGVLNTVTGGDTEAWLATALTTLPPGVIDPSAPDAEAQAFATALAPYCESATLSFNGEIPDGDDIVLRQATDPLTGKNYEGFERDLWRMSLVAEWEVEAGTVTSWTGFTYDDNSETQDSNSFALPGIVPVSRPGVPTYINPDVNVNSFSFDNSKETKQFSQELRYATNFDGPINVTVGALYWTEEVENSSSSITNQASGSHCFWNSLTGILNIVDADDGCTGYTDTPYAPYQANASAFKKPSPADRETDHTSVYGMFDFKLAETVTLNLEGRFNQEDVRVDGPVAYDPDPSGGPGGLNVCGIFFRACEPYDVWFNDGNWYADQYFPWTDEDANGDPLNRFFLDQAFVDAIPDGCRQQDNEAVERSIYDGPAMIEREPDGRPAWVDGGVAVITDPDTGRAVQNPAGTDVFNPWCLGNLEDDDSWFSPKITLEWQAFPDGLMYFSWSDARKPGGFSLLTVGSSFLNRELTEFDPEQMQVFELGGKSTWLDNTLVVNGAVFLQDFTDKQALTSALGNDGRLVSKVENAGSAEVWGAELELVWAPATEFLGGNWLFSGSYTWLDTEYTDFTVESGSPISAANAGNCTPTLVGDEPLCTLSYTGNDLEDAPDGAFVGFANYTFPLTNNTDFYVESDIQWTDKRFTGVTNNSWVSDFWNVDLRVGLTTERWEVLAYVRNLLDNDVVAFTGGGPSLGCCFMLGSSIDLDAETDPDTGEVTYQDPGTAVIVDLPLFTTAFLPDPRVIGLRATFRFGGS